MTTAFTHVEPTALDAAAANLAAISMAMRTAAQTAAGPTSGVVPPGLDEVSAQVAARLTAHAHEFQGVHNQLTTQLDQFVQTLNANARSYENAETANAHTTG